MKNITAWIVLLFGLFTETTFSQKQLVKHLAAVKPQTRVIYGTSLSAGAGGHAWANAVKDDQNAKLGGLLTLYNTAKSPMWPTRVFQHLEVSIIRKKTVTDNSTNKV